MTVMPNLSLAEKAAQMLLVGFRGYSVQPTDPIITDVKERNVGSVILFDQEMADTHLKGRNP